MVWISFFIRYVFVGVDTIGHVERPASDSQAEQHLRLGLRSGFFARAALRRSILIPFRWLSCRLCPRGVNKYDVEAHCKEIGSFVGSYSAWRCYLPLPGLR
jgi:hypothetical protein